jgi:hypothetical protein
MGNASAMFQVPSYGSEDEARHRLQKKDEFRMIESLKRFRNAQGLGDLR